MQVRLFLPLFRADFRDQAIPLVQPVSGDAHFPERCLWFSGFCPPNNYNSYVYT